MVVKMMLISQLPINFIKLLHLFVQMHWSTVCFSHHSKILCYYICNHVLCNQIIYTICMCM